MVVEVDIMILNALDFDLSSGMKNQILTLETDNRQLNLTIIQQEQRIKTIVQELALVQSERDSFKILAQNQLHTDNLKVPEELKKLIEPLSVSYAKELIDLKAKLVLLESNSRNGSTRSLTRASRSKSWVETPVKTKSEEWQHTLQETLVEAKEEIQKNIQLLESQDQPVDLGSRTFSGSFSNLQDEASLELISNTMKITN